MQDLEYIEMTIVAEGQERPTWAHQTQPPRVPPV